MGAYVGATVVTPAAIAGGFGGGGAYTNPSRCNDGDDASFSSYATPFVIGAGLKNLAGTPFASIEVRDFSPALGSTPQQILARVLHADSITYTGDDGHYNAGGVRQVQILTQYSVNGGTSWTSIASHTSASGSDLVLPSHVDQVLLTGVTPSAFRIRVVAHIVTFNVSSAFTGGTFTLDFKSYALEDSITVWTPASIMGFM